MRGAPNKKFFFVNKDANSDHLTHSPGGQWSEIQKHVQTGLKRPRKEAKSTTCKAKTPDQTKLLDDRAIHDVATQRMSCEFDPFGTSSVPVDSTVRNLLHYYIYYYHPTIWTYNPKTLRSKPYIFKSSVVQVVNTAIRDPLAMYALLAASSSRIQHVDRLPFPSAVQKEHFFMEHALQLMRKRIRTTPVDERDLTHILHCIMFLGSAEAYRNNLSAARIHLLTALEILGPGGVMKLTDKNLQGQILMADLFQACIYMRKCHCGFEYDPGPSSTLNLIGDELLPIDLSDHGQSLLDKDRVILPSPLWQIVGDLSESYRINCQLDVTAMTPERAFETTHWVTKRNMAIRSRILAIATYDDRVFALKTAIVMWTLLAMNITGRVKTVKMMAVKLKATLQHLTACAWAEYEDVHLWILFIGHSCARDDSGELAWFADQIKEASAWLYVSGVISGSYSTLTALEAFLKGFLYHWPVQRSRIEVIAEELDSSDCFVFPEFTPSSSASFEFVQRISTPL